ncbi:MAG: hypothetical protein N2043_11055 [Ignavibacterium sp.]|nr:hypothetical protein [Ignavibacterium sp.]
MKTLKLTIYSLFILIFITSCSNAPSSSLKKEQYEIINQNVKTFLGEGYEATNFTIVKEGFTDEQKNKYVVEITFDLNKPFILFDGKKIPAILEFQKNQDNKWVCTYNSANVSGFFNLFK